METLTHCPACESDSFTPFLSCKDNTVSRETFQIVACAKCGFKFTNPRPEEANLGDYYKSEDYISHSNSSKGFINSIYQFVRKYTLIKKLQLVERLNRGNKKNILDIGCGTGEFLNICKKAKWNTFGIEPGSDARKYASENYFLNVKEEAELKDFSNNQFEIITMWHVLEHVSKLNERILELKRLLKKDGTLLIAVPNCSSLDAKIYKQFWAAYDLPRHLYHFTPKDIEFIFAKHEMKVTQVLPMRLDSFYVSMLSEKYKRGNSNFILGCWNGFRSNINAIKSGKEFSSQIYIIKNK
ncbi:MAG: class I SAM-dependent methyltransferase [Bacteroidia bacterium]